MNFKLSVAAACLASTFALLPGCAVDAPADEAEMEEAGTTEDELSANAKKLVGAFHGQSSVRPPTFQGLVFNADGTFFGDLDTGIRCITTPCPSSEHLEGRYTATKNYLRLTPKSGSTSGFYGRYRYTFVSDILTLTSASIGSGVCMSTSADGPEPLPERAR